MKNSYKMLCKATVVVLMMIFSASNAWCFEKGDTIEYDHLRYCVSSVYELNSKLNANLELVPDESYKYLSNVVIPDQFPWGAGDTTCIVRVIANYAFKDCTALENITLPETNTVWNIGEYAFQNCSKLTSFTYTMNMPASALSGCTGITKIVVNASSVANCFSNIRNQVTEVVLTNKVTWISGYAFQDFRNVKSIVIPESVVSIDSRAFKSWESLTRIDLPASLESIDALAFSGCTNLDTITVNSANPYLDSRNKCNAVIVTNTNKLVLGCSETVIPNSVTEIGPSAFSNTDLKSVAIPASVTKIGAEAFNNCGQLASITVASGNTVYESPDGSNAIIDKSTKKLLVGCYTTVIPSTVTGIAPKAFSGVTKKFEITIPNTLKKIDAHAFDGCTGLYSIQIPKVQVIDTLAFNGCKGLKNIDLSNVLRIKTQAFRDCHGLDTVVVPTTLYELGKEAWVNCYGLKKVSIVRDEYVEYLKKLTNGSFLNCRALEEVVLPMADFELEEKVFYGCNNIKRVYCTDEAGCPKAAGNSFSDISNTSLYAWKRTAESGDVWYNFGKFVDMVTLNHYDKDCHIYVNVVGDYAEVTNDLDDDTGVQKTVKYSGSIVIPDSVVVGGKKYAVKNVEEKAFLNHQAITSVTIGKQLKVIGTSAFEGCTGLTTVNMTNAESLDSIASAAFKGCTSLTDISLPDTTTIISNDAFMGCTALKSAKLPANLLTLGEQAFAECKSLQAVNIPKGIKVIEKKAFYRCEKLATVTMHENVSDIRDYAFSYCQALKDITLPASLKTIGVSAFIDCRSLTDITLPENMQDIGEGAFRYCNGLTNIVLPTKMKTLNNLVFANCNNLKSIGLPEPMTTVGDQAFYQCSNLALLTIEANVAAIGQNAFNGCPLTNIYCKPVKAPDVFDNSFSESAYKNATLFLPVTSDTTYVKSLVWGRFKKGTLSTYALVYMVDGKEYKRDLINGGAVITPEPIPVNGTRRFSGWNGEPELMPAKDTVITGAFMYDINFIVKRDDKIVIGKDTLVQDKNIPDSLFYGTEVTAPKSWVTGSSIKWQGLPETMPAKDTTIVGSFVINKYVVTYMIDGVEYRRDSVEYLSKVEPPIDVKEKSRYIFEWGKYPETMPAKDVVVNGQYIPQVYMDGINIRIDKYNETASVIKYTPTGVNSKFAFNKSSNVNITSAVVPDYVLLEGKRYRVTSIADNAFNGFRKLTSVKLPNTIETIGEQAFRDCQSLTEFTIPEWVSSIGYGAFMYCSKIETIYCNTWFVPKMAANAFTSVVYQSAKVYVRQDLLYNFQSDDVWGQFATYDYISESYVVYMVDGKEYKKVAYKTGDEIVPEPDPVKDDRMFSGWSDIPAVMEHDDIVVTGNFLYELTYVFEGEQVGRTILAFCGTQMKTPNIPEREDHIVYWENAVSVMPDCDTTVIGYYVAQVDIDGVIIRVDKDKQVATVIANPDNNTAESVVIPASVTIEGKSYPVTTIGEGAFQGYESLSELTLPQTVTTIGANAFAGCTSLSLVTCHAMTVPVMPKNAFDDEAYSQATLMVPYNALNNYKKDSSWKQFANMDVSYKKGDANGDGVIDVEDIVAIVNYILGSPASNFIPEAADYNSDNLIDVEDIVGVVNSIMNGNPNYNAPQMRRILMNYGFKF